MGLTEYRQMQGELELLRTLSEAEADVRAGRVAPVADTFADIRARLTAQKGGDE